MKSRLEEWKNIKQYRKLILNTTTLDNLPRALHNARCMKFYMDELMLQYQRHGE